MAWTHRRVADLQRRILPLLEALGPGKSGQRAVSGADLTGYYPPDANPPTPNSQPQRLAGAQRVAALGFGSRARCSALPSTRT